MLSIEPLEFLYALINVVAFAWTFTALFDARSDRSVARLGQSSAVELVASGIVQNEAIRLLMQGVLLSFAVPGLFIQREVTLNQFSGGLIAISLLLLYQTFKDARERKALTAAVAADALSERGNEFAELKRELAENTAISTEAAAKADAAYEVANTINEKIAAQQEAGLALGEERKATEAALTATVDTTAEQVADLHEGTAPEKAP